MACVWALAFGVRDRCGGCLVRWSTWSLFSGWGGAGFLWVDLWVDEGWVDCCFVC